MSTPQRAKGSSSSSFGPEVGLARTAFSEGNLALSVIKVTYGGTSLARAWNPERSGGLFAEMVRFTKRQLIADQSAGVIDVLKGFVWFQGENDAMSVSDAADYLTNLATLVEATTRSLPFASGAKTVLIAQSSFESLNKRAGFGLCGDPDCTQERRADDLVRTAAQQLANMRPDIEFVDSFGLSRATDAVHLTGSSELAVGEAAARALGPALGLFEANLTLSPSTGSNSKASNSTLLKQGVLQ
jgi:hypothetical protein